MNAGVLGLPHGRLTAIESRESTVEDAGETLQICVDVVQQQGLDGETAAIEGRALREQMIDEDVAHVEDGEIVEGSCPRKQQQLATVAGTTATDDHDGFMLVGSSDDTWAFDVAGAAILQPAEINLAAFVNDHDTLHISTAGSPATGPVESLTAHGNNVLEDEEIGVGEHISDSIRAGILSQVRLGYDSPSYGLVSAYLAASGYVEVYEPDLETPEFLNLVAHDILPYASGGGDS